MKTNEKSLTEILCETACSFRSNIENHIKDSRFIIEESVEWLLDPLNAISHAEGLILDTFEASSRWERLHYLYVRERDALKEYVPYDEVPEDPELFEEIDDNCIYFASAGEVKLEAPKPNPYDKTMKITEELDFRTAHLIPSIWDDLLIPFNEVGIWEAVLLNEATAMMPLWWHAGYIRKKYVFSNVDMQEIYQSHKGTFDDLDKETAISWINRINRVYGSKFVYFDREKLASYLDSDDILPMVEITGDKAVVTYHYWNNWSGFCKRKIPVERVGRTVKIGEIDREVLVKYDCGIRY